MATILPVVFLNIFAKMPCQQWPKVKTRRLQVRMSSLWEPRGQGDVRLKLPIFLSKLYDRNRYRTENPPNTLRPGNGENEGLVPGLSRDVK